MAGPGFAPEDDGFLEAFGWIDAVVEIAQTINTPWDAVWDMPAVTFLHLIRYRKAKADHERRLAARARGKNIIA